MYIILINLQVILLFVCTVVKSFEKVFIYLLAMVYIIVYRTTIIPNVLDKVAHSIEFLIV